jgi:hypothetical protein
MLFFSFHFIEFKLKIYIFVLIYIKGKRSSIFYHDFANVTYLTLDSGYLHEFSGWQEHLIVKFYSEHLTYLKFVNYHVPIYKYLL